MADEMQEPLPTDILEEIDGNQEQEQTTEQAAPEVTTPIVASSMEELNRKVREKNFT